MAVNESYFAYIEDQLSEFGEFETKLMFGGMGFFRNGIMFGLIGKDIFHLKVNDTNREEFESRGMTAFLSTPEKKGLPYYEVPVEIIEDKEELKKWAEQSYRIAENARKK